MGATWLRCDGISGAEFDIFASAPVHWWLSLSHLPPLQDSAVAPFGNLSLLARSGRLMNTMQTVPRELSLDADADAVAAIRGGDRERYRELVERHSGKVFAVAWCRLGDRDLAEEVTQEAFIKGYRGLPCSERQSGSGRGSRRSRGTWQLILV
jgi:hypothetical protein